MPMPTSVANLGRTLLVVKTMDRASTREIWLEDLSWDMKNESTNVKTEGAVGFEEDTAPADVTVTMQIRDAKGGLDWAKYVSTPGMRFVELTLRTQKGTLEVAGPVNGLSEKQPRGPGHNQTVTFAGSVVSWVPAA